MKKLFTLRWIIIHILVLSLVVLFVQLGFWQLDRLEQRRDLNTQLLADFTADITPITGEESLNPAELHQRRVEVTGTFDNDEGIILQNRPLDGRAGVRLVVPLRIAGSDKAVLVERGWIPLAEQGRESRRAYHVQGQMTIQGMAFESEAVRTRYNAPPDPTLTPEQTRLDSWFQADIERIEAQLPYDLLPILIRQAPEVGDETPPIAAPIAPELGEGSHMSYAIQWFMFAVILLCTYGGLMYQEVRPQEAAVVPQE